MFRRAAHQFHSGGSSHGGSYAHLGLTTAHSTRHSGVAHGKITHSTCVKKRICYFFITEIKFFLKSQKHPGDHTGRTGGGGRYDKTHGGIDLQHGAGVGDGSGKHTAADRSACGAVFREQFRLSSDQSAYGSAGIRNRRRSRFLHDLPGFIHSIRDRRESSLAAVTFSYFHDLRNRTLMLFAERQKFRPVLKIHGYFLLYSVR